jgi:hypothetical protein
MIEEEQPSTVRVTLTDGTEVTLRGPLIRNDSIGGVALSDISTVEVRRISIAKTLGVIGAFYVGLILICAPEDSCR